MPEGTAEPYVFLSISKTEKPLFPAENKSCLPEKRKYNPIFPNTAGRLKHRCRQRKPRP